MNWRFSALALGAILAGAAVAVFIAQSFFFRDLIGRSCGRGHLVAVAGGEGIYQADLERALAEFLSRTETAEERDPAQMDSWRRSIASQLGEVAAAARLASAQELSGRDIEREMSLLRFQFRDEKTFLATLSASGLSERSLRRMLLRNLKTRRWIDRRIGADLNANPEECRNYYDTHASEFWQPVRLRASHLFLAAPPETPEEIVDQKREKIEALAKRAKTGENLADLIPVESEDEATKRRGGDLGFFSAIRMPADFYEAAARLPTGKMSDPVQTGLGFHLIQVTDLRPAAALSFDQARDEIAALLLGEKRREALRQLHADLTAQIRFRDRISGR